MRSLPLAAACLCLGWAAWADGLSWEAASGKDLVAEKAQTAWLDWKDGTERLVVAVDPEAGSSRLAWLLPVPVPAKEARLTLASSAPDWTGEEVRVKANLAHHPVLLGFYFFTMLLLASRGGSGCAIVLLIVLVLSAISIGPGPGMSEYSEGRVETTGRVALGGLVSELAEAPSVPAFEAYLKAKSTALPEAGRGMIEDHLREGKAFVVSWAEKPKIDQALALEVSFPAAEPWYPVRLTSAYGGAKTPIDLRVSGWREPGPGVPSSALTGYYRGAGEPAEYTRVLFQGRAKALGQDWTFGPRRRTADLRLAAAVGGHPFVANVLLLLAASLAAGLVLGPVVLPELRGRSSAGRLLVLAASGVLPFVGPLAVLRRFFPDAVSEPEPLPRPPQAPAAPPPATDPRYRWGAVAAVAGACCQAAGLFSEGPLGPVGSLVGWALSSAGLSVFFVLKGHPRRSSIFTACAVSLIPVLGVVVGLFSKPGFQQAPPASSPRPEVPSRWNVFALGLAACCLLLHLGASAWMLSLWPLDRSTASISHSGKFRSLVRKSNEGACKGNLGSIRSALNTYYGDANGSYPSSLESLTIGAKYLPSLPLAKAPDYHPDSNKVLLLSGARYAAGELDDTGGWAYVVDGPDKGTVFVNCAHTDTKGSSWDSY